jgi:pimeloyl-ACP methyl ester carboxylesterase
MSSVQANGITIEYDVFGESSARPLLLVMGLGTQMIGWDEEFCQKLADTGHYVVRFDNRDIGLSSKMDDAPVPVPAELMMEMMQGNTPEVPYSLNDMADDAIGLLDALNIDSSHICGASMGGMIVQTMALTHGERVRSMTSIMSTTGNPELPAATPEAMESLTKPPAADRDSQIEQSVATQKVIGSSGFPFDAERARQKAAAAYDRSFYPQGTARQMAAIVAAGNRRPRLESLDLPTLVIHGKADPLVPVTGGQDTHEAIAGSELLLVEGMGHDLPPGAWDEIISSISTFTSRNDQIV